jgi:CheY-like chemotaxis protein
MPTSGSQGDLATGTPVSLGGLGRHGAGTVLVVEDEEAVRTTVEKILIALGFSVVLAADGQEGVAKFAQDQVRFSLVLLDLTMPKLDGVQVYREIRRLNTTIPVLLMSGHGEQQARAHFSGQNLSGFLQKPFDLLTLQRALTAAMAWGLAPTARISMEI